MSRWLKRSLIAVAIIIGLLLLSMLVVPWQLKKQGTAWIADHTERTLGIEKVYFNPFTLKLELSGIALTEPNSDQHFVSCGRLMVSVSLRSIIDQALILRRIELDQPYVKIDLLGRQVFNFSDFIHIGDDAPPVESVDEAAKPFLFSFNNIVI
ncbi:MAG: AsmA family protein, partial [Desulfuromonas sp.]|nr:AsmA family protein [Desulfuromonas sp.]